MFLQKSKNIPVSVFINKLLSISVLRSEIHSLTWMQHWSTFFFFSLEVLKEQNLTFSPYIHDCSITKTLDAVLF